jgi:predicted dehydrogenase
MSASALKIGLVGLGSMGKNHLRILSMLKEAELVFISDLNQQAAQTMAATHGTHAVADPFAALDTVDAVVICTPTATHADYIMRIGKSVKNIFVEKPLAATVKEARVVKDFADVNGLNVQVGFIERYNPAVQGLKDIIEKSERVISVDFTRTNKLSSRITDVDVVIDLMIHDIDLALYLNGPARSVAAHGFARGDVIDFASTLITHDNGRFSRIQASRITEKKMRKIEATCTDMFVDCELLRKEILITRQSEIVQTEGQPYKITATQEAVEVRPQEALLSELLAFIASCAAHPDDNHPNAKAGLSALEIADIVRNEVLK